MYVETLLRRVVDLAEEYPRGEGLVESSTSDYATLKATEKGRKALKGFRE